MWPRVLILFLFLLLRVILNVIQTFSYHDSYRIRVFGSINKIEQYTSNCNIYVGRFLIEKQGFCNFSQGARISVIGTYKRRVIDVFYGNLWLSDAVIDTSLTDDSHINKSLVWTGVFRLFREKISYIYSQYLPSREAALVAGIVLGDKKGISGDFYKEMLSSGTVHIAVASGYNVMIVGGTVLSILFWKLRRRTATVVAIVVMLLYSLLTGAEPPVMRAFVMAAMLFVGASIGRKQVTWWALLLTAWVMLLTDISIIKSISFQLSVMASIGLMVIEPLIMRYIDTLNSKLLQLISTLGLVTTMATMVTTAPIIWWHFGRFTLNGFIGNTLILPLVPILMFFGAVMIITGPMMSLPVYLLSHLMVLIIGVIGR